MGSMRKWGQPRLQSIWCEQLDRLDRLPEKVVLTLSSRARSLGSRP